MVGCLWSSGMVVEPSPSSCKLELCEVDIHLCHSMCPINQDQRLSLSVALHKTSQLKRRHNHCWEGAYVVEPQCPPSSLVIFFFPYNPHPKQAPDRPTRGGLISVHFGSIWLRSGPFGSVSGLFRVRFGVLGGVGVGSWRGASVREKNITNQVDQILE